MKSYSLYEAKARLSEIMRRVREHGESVTVTYHGEPVAEIRPFEKPEGGGWAARLKELERTGVVRLAEPDSPRPVPGPQREGALARFLREREE